MMRALRRYQTVGLLCCIWVCQAQFQPDVSLLLNFLDNTPNSWLQPPASLVAPSGRAYHTATAFPDQDKMFIYGGVGAPYAYVDQTLQSVCLLVDRVSLPKIKILPEMWEFNTLTYSWTPLRLNATSPGPPCLFGHTSVTYKASWVRVNVVVTITDESRSFWRIN